MAYSCIGFIFFICIFPLRALAQINGTVPVGSILTANESSRPWLSPSGDFAFGFKQLQDNDQFLLSIWYEKIPDKTVVWYINSGTINPAVPRGSTIQLDGQAGLVLHDPQGQSIWTSNASGNRAFQGFMNDTGNFILQGSDGSSLWESFGFPADTILPTQELALGSVVDSRKSRTNFSQGRFYLQFRDDGDLVLYYRLTMQNDAVVYYDVGTSDPTNQSNSGYHFIFDNQGSIYIMKRDNQTVKLSLVSAPNASENYLRTTLDFDGVFTLYSHPKTFSGNPVWNIVWSKPDNICIGLMVRTGSGVCGFNSICSLVNGRPVCHCPAIYTLVDPNDEYGSCKPNFTLTCDESDENFTAKAAPTAVLYDFLELTNINWPLNDFEMIRPATEESCRQACSEDCFCAVSIFGNHTCYKKRLPLSNGRVESTLTNSKIFMKYRTTDARPPTPKDRGTLVAVESALLGISLFVNMALMCLGYYLINRKRKTKVKLQSGVAAMETNLRCFTSKELIVATNGFREELGRGAFGIVYKGELRMGSGSIPVAVKKLDRLLGDGDKEFRAEMNSIGQTNHKNLVHLLGFCDEAPHRSLVYEYMANGTLASFIFADQKPSWSLRTQMAIGIARGLVYLHEECSTRIIIHCDIKPRNILLDEYYNPRISDFGLAKLLAINQSRISLTDVRGTKGYVAPEWFRNAQITAKVDVYSFGVMLLEIISCRRCVDGVEIGGENYGMLTDFVWDCFQERRLDAFVQNDLEALQDKTMVERFVIVGIWCIQENPSLRPTMRKVSQMLEGIVGVTIPPCPYPLYTTEG